MKQSLLSLPWLASLLFVTCHSNTDNNFWLLDCTIHPNTPLVGDTIVVDNETYTDVIKVKGLLPEL